MLLVFLILPRLVHNGSFLWTQTHKLESQNTNDLGLANINLVFLSFRSSFAQWVVTIKQILNQQHKALPDQSSTQLTVNQGKQLSDYYWSTSEPCMRFRAFFACILCSSVRFGNMQGNNLPIAISEWAECWWEVEVLVGTGASHGCLFQRCLLQQFLLHRGPVQQCFPDLNDKKQKTAWHKGTKTKNMIYEFQFYDSVRILVVFHTVPFWTIPKSHSRIPTELPRCGPFDNYSSHAFSNRENDACRTTMPETADDGAKFPAKQP